jgi:cell division protein FtsB
MPTQRSAPANVEQEPGSGAAPLFWVCLVVAAALYAPCVLAGRIVAWSDLQRSYQANQAALVAAQQQVQHLQRVADALESDPEFAKTLARAALKAAPEGTTVIDLPPELNRDPRLPQTAPALEPPVDPWYLPFLRRVAADAKLRRNLLLAAAGVFLFGFLVFRERTPGAATADQRAPRGLLRTLFGRYLRDRGGVSKV